MTTTQHLLSAYCDIDAHERCPRPRSCQCDCHHPAQVPDVQERWVVRLMVTRDPRADAPPTGWNWNIDGADVVVLSGEIVGIVAPEAGD
jgi:hypothetical protein